MTCTSRKTKIQDVKYHKIRGLGSYKLLGNITHLNAHFSSELEEVYEQFNQWLNDPIVDAESGEHKNRELDSRDLAVIR